VPPPAGRTGAPLRSFGIAHGTRNVRSYGTLILLLVVIEISLPSLPFPAPTCRVGSRGKGLGWVPFRKAFPKPLPALPAQYRRGFQPFPAFVVWTRQRPFPKPFPANSLGRGNGKGLGSD
jgi:hypothetical protein